MFQANRSDILELRAIVKYPALAFRSTDHNPFIWPT